VGDERHLRRISGVMWTQRRHRAEQRRRW